MTSQDYVIILLPIWFCHKGYYSDETPAIGTERCRTTDNRCTTARLHHIDTATAPVTTGTTTCRLQDHRPGFPVLDWSGTWLPGRRLSARRRHQRSPTFDQQTQRPVSRAARPTSSATDASQLPVHGYGTRCQSI